MATFTGTLGVDNFIGTDGAGDRFRFLPGNLGSTDTVSGGLGTATDSLEILGAGEMNAAQLSHVSGVEVIRMFAGSSIELTANMLATARNNIVTVVGSAGNDAVFGGDIANAAHRLFFTANTGRDSFVGGAGKDKVSIGASQITNQDIFVGGDGSDLLQITSAGALANTALGNVFAFETVALNAGGNTLTLSQSTAASTTDGVITVTGLNGGDQLDAASLTWGRVNFKAGLGNNSFVGGGSADIANGGSGNDDFRGNAGNDTLNGGAGSNTLSGGDGDDVLTSGIGISKVTGGLGRDTITVASGDTGNPDTLVYTTVADGTSLGDNVRGNLGVVGDGDIKFAFTLAAFNTLGNNFDVVGVDSGDNGTAADGADLVLYSSQLGVSLGSAAAVDAYFDENYSAASGVGAFLAEFDIGTGLVTIYYDPNAASASAVHVIATIQGMNDLEHADLGDNFAFL